MLADSWDFATINNGWGVWAGEGCDEIDPPIAIFQQEQWAKDFAAYLEKRAREQDEVDGFSVGCSYHPMQVRNVQVPFWNDGDPLPADNWPPSCYDEADHIETIARLEKQNNLMRAALEELFKLDLSEPVPSTYLAGVRAALKEAV